MENLPTNSRTAWLKRGVIFAILLAPFVFLLIQLSQSNAFVYSKLVHEVVQQPAQYKDRELRVEGELKPGSIQFRQEPCEWRFVIHKQGKELPVRFPQCIVPDTFRDGMGISVTVQGKLEGQGAFLANQLIPRCPSKYEMQARFKKGETMPHAAPAPSLFPPMR